MMHPYPPCPGRRLANPVHLPGGCRCLVESGPTILLVQALMGMGWSLQEQGRQVDPTVARPGDFRVILDRVLVTRGMAMRVAEMFDRLWNQPGDSLRSVNHAITMGWKVADPEVVKRLVAGVKTPHNKIERDIAIRIVARREDEFPTCNVIALHLGTRISIVRRVLSEAA